MQETLQALLGLQEIDRKIFKVEAELRRLPKEQETRQAHIANLEERINEKRQAALEMRRSIKEIEDVTTTQRQRIRKLEGEAQKSKSDAATLAAYDHEIRTLKKTVSQAEDDGLKLIERAEALEAEAKADDEQLEEERKVFEQFKENVAKETAAAEEQLAEHKKRIEDVSANEIHPDHLALYKRLIATREGEAMAELQGRICQGCYVEIPKNVAVRLARGIELVTCQSCDRILYIRY